MGRQDLAALEAITYTLHREAHAEFDCDAGTDDAMEDHDAELAVAGQIVMDLRRAGLTVSKTRSDKGRPKRVALWRPMRDGIDYDSSEQ